MLTVLVLIALKISPGILLAEESAPGRTRGVQSSPGVRWVDGATLGLEPAAPGTEDAGLHRAARLLEQERTELEQTRPRILLPVLLTTGGLAAALGGIGFIWAGLFTAAYYAFSFAAGSVVLLSIGIVLFAAGIPLTTIGAVKLHRARQQRRKIDQRLERLDHEAAQMQKVLSF